MLSRKAGRLELELTCTRNFPYSDLFMCVLNLLSSSSKFFLTLTIPRTCRLHNTTTRRNDDEDSMGCWAHPLMVWLFLKLCLYWLPFTGYSPSTPPHTVTWWEQQHHHTLSPPLWRGSNNDTTTMSPPLRQPPTPPPSPHHDTVST